MIPADEVVLSLSELQSRVLASLVTQLVELLRGVDGADAGQGSPDPLWAQVGIGAAARAPADPALARLFPDAYPDDAEASDDFRRYTQADLRERKLGDAQSVLDALGAGGEVTAGQARTWVACLNDIRLILGERMGLGVEQADPAADPVGDPQADPEPMAELYDWLTAVQGHLIEVMVTAEADLATGEDPA